MIRYIDTLEGIEPSQLRGFFQGWRVPPTPQTHLRLLAGSDEIVLAVDEESGKVIGFISAITDGVLAAYIPFLEVLPAYKREGIGSELARRMLARLKQFYMVDLLCDAEVRPFYSRLGLEPATGMVLRNHDRQSGT